MAMKRRETAMKGERNETTKQDALSQGSDVREEATTGAAKTYAANVQKQESARRREIARKVVTGHLTIPVILYGTDVDVRRDVMRRTASYLIQDGTRTCMLQLDKRSEADAYADLAVASSETILDDDAPRAVICDGLPLGDQSFDRKIVALIEHGCSKGTRIVLGVTPEQADISYGLTQSVTLDTDAHQGPARLRLPLHTYLLVKEAAIIARTSESYIYDLIRQKRFTEVERRGRRILLRTAAFLRFLGIDEDDIR